MSIHVALHHVTRYNYDRLINLGPQIVRLRPAAHSRTRILSYSMKVSPGEHFINWQQDPQGNYLGRLVFPEKTNHFEIAVDLVVEMSVLNPFDFFLEEHAQNMPFEYNQNLKKELAPYLKKRREEKAYKDYLSLLPTPEGRTIDWLVALNQKLCQDIRYTIRMEPGVQSPGKTLTLKSGSCRDSAWLMVQLLRSFGYAARFVSGYLIQLTSDVKAIDGPNGPESDFTDLHAWCEVFLPGAGWIGFDPTSGLLAGEGHIPLACSADPSSAAPIEGVLDECEVSFEHEMSVSRVLESPRTSKPYSEEQWEAIKSLGYQVDEVLQANDVRLTMGGEPTFVADRDRGAQEWNTQALGPTKRKYGMALMNRMRKFYGQGGVLHCGQGKWYPGEQLPRWAMSYVWRKDGQAIWNTPELLANDEAPGSTSKEVSGLFLAALAEELGVPSKFMLAGFEDTWYYLWRERRLPCNVDPFDSRLEDELERKRLQKVFSEGLAEPVGHCLPLSKRNGYWETGPWFLRNERMYLIPGDSPMGFRLPLDSQPWVSKADYPYLIPRDPFSEEGQDPLPSQTDLQSMISHLVHGNIRQQGQLHQLHQGGFRPAARRMMQMRPGQEQQTRNPAPFGDRNLLPDAETPRAFESASWVVRTAMCCQVRNGHLYVFMPPVERTEDYLEVISAAERVAVKMNQPIVLEGYPPPRDSRLQVLAITPDPGVLEVNVQPGKTWNDLLNLSETLYEQARLTHLSTEKFMLDGRHSGTGGGNHFVMGGETPADSPFLRRPDLLASLLRYWHNHPGLSYLFSGLFIGPTSQAPRVDEARTDQTHELELALTELERQIKLYKGQPPLWMIDRILRNILVDSTGNTHRSEFCIDKLYSPDSPTGRLGLLELRAFEMPPHERMSMAQQLLLRALIAKFWVTPYKAKLVKWGTSLHDRYMLSTFVKRDLDDIIYDLNIAGFEFKTEWFAPHLTFRFPKIGDFNCRGVQVDVFTALEPWHVLGEEGAAGGTVRYVDSSVERLEVVVSNHIDSRYVLTCNGHEVPLHPTGKEGQFVAGIRYKAWQPPNGLHPTIGVHTPLRLDLFDTWNYRSLGGCEYHVSHPGGRSYDLFPVNAFEAESRRLSRFFRFGHSQGHFIAQATNTRGEFPMTMDLRWL